MIKKALLGILILSSVGCTDEINKSSGPKIDTYIDAEVHGYSHPPQKFYDVDTGVTCYYIYHKTMSCVKTGDNHVN